MAKRWTTTTIILAVAIVAAATCLCMPAFVESFTPAPRESLIEGVSVNEKTTFMRNTIFVSVASYRDVECSRTINDMFAKADHPERVFVGVCEQNVAKANTEEACVRGGKVPAKQIRKVFMPSTDAKGPTYARYICSKLYRGERVFMQIDSHTTFTKGWDTKVFRQLAMCPDPHNTVLTTYPHDDKTYTIDEPSVPVICTGKWNEDGIPTFEAVVKQPSFFKNKRPMPTAFASAGLLIFPGHILKKVPYDPNLPHLFQGEEALYTCRLWTAGCDIFCPSENIVLHHYLRKESPKYWTDAPDAYNRGKAQSLKRVKRILGLEQPVIPPGSDPYALGKVRTMDQYWQFSGLDPVRKTKTPASTFC